MKPIPKEWNWGDFGIGMACFGLVAGSGLVATAINVRNEKTPGIKKIAPVLIPATITGVIGFFLRRQCPPCPAGRPPMRAEIPTPVPERTIIGYPYYRGYGRVAAHEDVVSRTAEEWVLVAGEALAAVGYEVEAGTQITVELQEAVADYQAAHGLAVTGWLDNETTAILSHEAEMTVATVTEEGIGFDVPNPVEEEKKTNWAAILGGVGSAVAGGAATIVAIAKGS